MNALLMTLSILFLMLTLSGAQLRSDRDHHLMAHSLQTLLRQRLDHGEEEEQLRNLEARLERKTPDRSNMRPRPEAKTRRGPQKRRLYHVPTRLEFAPSSPDHQQVLLNLMEILYRDQPFYSGEVAEQIVTQLAEKKLSFTLLDQLATIDLEDPQLQSAWLRMLRGQPGLYDSLLRYISLGEGRPVRVVHAPLPLLQAVYGEHEEVAEIAAWRQSQGGKFDGEEMIRRLEPLSPCIQAKNISFAKTASSN